MGFAKGAPIPIKGGAPNQFMKDRSGNVVISKLDEKTLQEVAIAGNGAYIPANNIRKGINNLLDELSDLEKKEIDAKVYTEYDEQFQYFAGLVLLLLLIDFFLLERKNKYLKDIDLFVTETKKEK